MTPRQLPPGTLRRLRLKWFALGVFLGVSVCIVFAMWLAAIAPPEMAYRGVSPAPRALVADIRHASVQIPPCVGEGKDCEQINPVPEPGTLALIGAGIALMWRKAKWTRSNTQQWQQQ